MTTTLKRAFERAAELPEAEQEAFARFLLDELEFVAAIQEGIVAADQGEVVPVAEVRKMVPKWISESSSRDRR
jgi:predicted transcriptional regulator